MVETMVSTEDDAHVPFTMLPHIVEKMVCVDGGAVPMLRLVDVDTEPDVLVTVPNSVWLGVLIQDAICACRRRGKRSLQTGPEKERKKRGI